MSFKASDHLTDLNLVVCLQDFEVGKIYKKKVVLTNTSYATNSCRLLGVSAHLKDLVSIK